MPQPHFWQRLDFLGKSKYSNDLEMKILLPLLILAVSLSSAAAENDNSMVHRFYQILVQPDAPSIKDEIETFVESDGISAVLKSREKESDTPRWNFLRENRDWFLPQSPKGIERVQISAPFKMFSSKLGRYRNNKNILVYFSDNSDSAVSIRCILFRLAPDGRIDLDGIFFPERGILYDFVYKRTSPLSHE